MHQIEPQSDTYITKIIILPVDKMHNIIIIRTSKCNYVPMAVAAAAASATACQHTKQIGIMTI